MSGDYQLVPLANGEKTLFSATYGEKMHPGLGPAEEADVLYVRQLKIRERLECCRGEFVIWDIGLGAAANAVAALRATREVAGELRLVSFDNTNEPLEFALKNANALGFIDGYEGQVAGLLRDRYVEFINGMTRVKWEFHLEDFPMWLGRQLPARQESTAFHQPAGAEASAPHAIFFDAFSPAKNPAMWTLPMFESLFGRLDPARACALTTYSRSTLVRATLLLAGFFVGVGHATGFKEETTIAANSPALIDEPLDARWLARAGRSESAQPLREQVYARAPLHPELLERLRQHPQFQG